MDENEGWPYWRKLIVSEMKRLSNAIEKANDRHDGLKEDVIKLKVWSAVYGFAGGIIATLLFQKVIMG